MLLSPRDARRVWAGRKVQHRLPRARTPPDEGRSVPISYRRPCPALGYTREGTPKLETVMACRVIILRVEAADTRDALDADARDEGYHSLADLIAEHGPDGRVWVIRMIVDESETPRLLSREVVAGRQGDYTDNPHRALLGEMEAVDAATLDLFTAQARERDLERRQERHRELGLMPFQDQVRELASLAKQRRVDVRDELRAIRRWGDPRVCQPQLDSMRAKLGVSTRVDCAA